MVEWATEIKVRAERRAGELLAAMEKNVGVRTLGPSRVSEPSDTPTLDSLGITTSSPPAGRSSLRFRMSDSRADRAPQSIEVRWRNLTATVCRNEGHPENYLWIFVEGKRFFLGVLTPGMTRGDVRRMARDWLAERERPSRS